MFHKAMFGISWYSFEKSDCKGTWSALFLCKKGEPVKGTESKGGLKTEKAIRNYPKPKKAILDSSWLSNIAGNYIYSLELYL